MALVRTVREVEAEYVDARGDQFSEDRFTARRRTDGRDDFCLPHIRSLQYAVAAGVTRAAVRVVSGIFGPT